MSIYYVNGAYVEENDCLIPARDLAVLRGYGAFDYLRTYNARTFRLEQNIARLRRSCEVIGLSLPWTDEELSAIVQETLKRNHDSEAYRHDDYSIRIVVTGGISPDNITPIEGEAGLVVMVAPVRPLPATWYDEGAKVATVPTQRVYPTAKSINYIPAIVAQREASAKGAIEALYVDDAGNVTEGATTNLFAFYGNKLVTPPLAGNILSGCTRTAIMELAQGHYQVEERSIGLEELYQADEVFITAANKRVLPIVQVDDKRISLAPGECTRHIMALFDEITFGVNGR